MTNEEKQILFIDLCERLPYGVKCHEDYVEYPFDIIGSMCYNKEFIFSDGYERQIEQIKPYLRPISSMTESEIYKLFDILHIDKGGNDDDWIKINDVVGIKFFFPTGKWVENVAEAYDYLNSIHIDYRGLIEKGLALEAPKDMYKTK